MRLLTLCLLLSSSAHAGWVATYSAPDSKETQQPQQKPVRVTFSYENSRLKIETDTYAAFYRSGTELYRIFNKRGIYSAVTGESMGCRWDSQSGIARMEKDELARGGSRRAGKWNCVEYSQPGLSFCAIALKDLGLAENDLPWLVGLSKTASSHENTSTPYTSAEWFFSRGIPAEIHHGPFMYLLGTHPHLVLEQFEVKKLPDETFFPPFSKVEQMIVQGPELWSYSNALLERLAGGLTSPVLDIKLESSLLLLPFLDEKYRSRMTRPAVQSRELLSSIKPKIAAALESSDVKSALRKTLAELEKQSKLFTWTGEDFDRAARQPPRPRPAKVRGRGLTSDGSVQPDSPPDFPVEPLARKECPKSDYEEICGKAVMRKFTCKNGFVDGKYEEWEQGNLSVEQTYSDGVANGPFRRYLMGSLMEEETYSKGLRSGVRTVYFESAVGSQTKFRNGRSDGKTTLYGRWAEARRAALKNKGGKPFRKVPRSPAEAYGGLIEKIAARLGQPVPTGKPSFASATGDLSKVTCEDGLCLMELTNVRFAFIDKQRRIKEGSLSKLNIAATARTPIGPPPQFPPDELTSFLAPYGTAIETLVDKKEKRRIAIPPSVVSAALKTVIAEWVQDVTTVPSPDVARALRQFYVQRLDEEGELKASSIYREACAAVREPVRATDLRKIGWTGVSGWSCRSKREEAALYGSTRKRSGKYYWEFEVRTSALPIAFGVSGQPHVANDEHEERYPFCLAGAEQGQVKCVTVMGHSNPMRLSSKGLVAGDLVRVAVDLDKALFTYAVGNRWELGDPADKHWGVSFRSPSSLKWGYYPLISLKRGSSVVPNLGSSKFRYEMPKGFVAWRS